MDKLKNGRKKKRKHYNMPRMTQKENQLYYVALSSCQIDGTMVEKDIIASINNYEHLYFVAEEVVE